MSSFQRFLTCAFALLIFKMATIGLQYGLQTRPKGLAHLLHTRWTSRSTPSQQWTSEQPHSHEGCCRPLPQNCPRPHSPGGSEIQAGWCQDLPWSDK